MKLKRSAIIRIFSITLLFTPLVFTTGCKTARPYDYSQEPDPRLSKRGFEIGPADQIQITVWRHNDLSTQATVRPDGIITIPLIGDLKATGKTPAELRDIVKKHLTKYIKDTTITVTVAVTNVVSYRFTVSGNVTRPGLFTSSRFVTVQEAIAMAGGPTRFADSEKSVLVRRDKAGKIRRIPINYPLIAKGKTPEQNIVILRGDIIHVP